jgi:hypothetical protein
MRDGDPGGDYYDPQVGVTSGACDSGSSITVTDSPPDVEPDPCQGSDAGCGGSGSEEGVPLPDNGSGSSGSTVIPGSSITSASQAKKLLLTALQTWTNCDNVLGQGAVNYAGRMNFVDGGLGGDGRMAQSEMRRTNTVTLFVNFYGIPDQNKYRSATDQATTLVHELIHSYFPLLAGDHINIIDKFKIAYTLGQDKSTVIDNWIARDCQ